MKRHAVWFLLAAAAVIAAAGPAFAQEPLKIGMHAMLTGPLAEVGKDAQFGAQAAVAMINDSGGVRGRKVELVLYDDQARPAEAVTAVRRLITRDKVVAIVSGSISGTTKAVAPVAQEAKVPYVAAYAVHPEIAPTGKFIFANSLHGVVQGRAGARIVAQQLKAKRVAMLVVDNDFGRTLAKAFRGEAQALGAAIAAEEVYPFGEKDFRAILTRIKGTNPDVIYTTGYPGDATQTLKQARELGITTQFVGTEAIDHPEVLFPLAGDLAEGLIVTTALDRDDPRPVVQQFLQRYQAAAGRPADMVGASTFDAVRLVAHAIGLAGTDPDAIAAALAGLTNFDGAVTGPLVRYTQDRQVIKPVYAQVVKGKAFHRYGVVNDPEVITPR